MRELELCEDEEGRTCRNRRDGRDGHQICHPAALFPRKRDWPLSSMRASEFYICALKIYIRVLKFYMRIAKFNMRAREFYMRPQKLYIRTCLMYLRAAKFYLEQKRLYGGRIEL